jgi:HD-like signal output (HDOD) protein
MNWTAIRQSLIGDRNETVLPPNIKLPMLPTAVTEFSRKADDPNSTAAQLGKIIEADSGLTCELLRYVNSATIGLRTKAASAQSAISMLGIRASKLFLLTVGVQHAMKASKSRLINFQNFWTTNLERALFAREVARLLKANVDVAYAASMLHDFLLPLLTNELFPHYLRFTEIPEAERGTLIAFEQKTFGWDHPLATAQMMLSWGFPDDLVCAVLLHHSGATLLADNELGRTAAAAVAIAALIPDPLRQSGQGIDVLIKLSDMWPNFDLHVLATKVQESFTEMAPAATSHLSLLKRVEKLMDVAAAAQ